MESGGKGEDNSYKKSPILRPRIKWKTRMEATTSNKKNCNKDAGDAGDGNKNDEDGYEAGNKKDDSDEDNQVIPKTPEKPRVVRLMKKKKEDIEQSQSLLAIAKNQERESLIYYGFNSRNVKK